MPDRACGACETGVYDRSAYLQRVQKVDAEKAELAARPEALRAAEPERDIRRIPVPSKASDEYRTLESEDRDRLLEGMAGRMGYEKAQARHGIGPAPARDSRNLDVYHLVPDL